jgi:hypothetical protein
MSKSASGTLCAVLLVVALSAIASPAWAGNGHGNGSGNGNGNGNGASDAAAPQSQPASSPGNSGSAPGQGKKDGEDAKPDHGNGASAQPAAPATGPTQGVKPGNSTAHNTNAPAGSDQTKKYGNGKTAGQIAIQNGYPSSGNLHGPGNSQPHKVTTCGHRHGVDVHALKSHPGRSCGTPEPPRPPHVPTGPPTPSGPPVVPVTPHGPSTPPAKPTHDPGHGSSSVVATETASGDGSDALGATVEQATLPFTGFPLWAAVLAAAILIGVGLTLRRLARTRA